MRFWESDIKRDVEAAVSRIAAHRRPSGRRRAHLRRDPDHRIASELGRDACYLAGLAKYDAPGKPHRPEKILYALAYREDPVKPTFVVDISAEFETKLEAIRCYASQFDGAESAGEIHPTGLALYDLIRVRNAHYGSLIRAAYGEPFMTQETVRVDDVVTMGVRSI